MTLGSICRIEIQNSKKILDKMNAGARRALVKQGAYIRTVAKRSITTKDHASLPGHAPRSITGLLRDFIIFKFESSQASVIVGPALLSGVKNHINPTIPEILEVGGTEMATVRRGKEWQRRPVSVAARPYMAPAFERSKAKLTEFWEKSLIT